MDISDDYFVYKIFFMDTGTVGGDAFNFRVRTGTNGASENSENEYYYAYNYVSRTSGGQQQGGDTGGFGGLARIGWSGGGSGATFATTEMTIYEPAINNNRTHFSVMRNMWDNSYWGFANGSAIFNKNNTPVTGIKLFHGNGNISLNQVKNMDLNRSN